MAGVIVEKVGVTDELLQAAEKYGPRSEDTPYERGAFPMIALPEVLRQYVQHAAAAMDVPPECIATPAIGVCATAIGASCQVRLKNTWFEPAVIWAITLQESGSLKTPAYKAAFAPLITAQRIAEEEFQARKEEYKVARAQYDADAGLWRTQSTVESTSAPPSEPEEPKPLELYTSDSTVEALALLFGNNPRGLALTRDELSGFFESFGAYKGGRGGDEATYLEFYDAGAIKLNRASGKRIFVPRAALSIFGTCQPAVFAEAIGATGRKHNQVENGMAARFLIAAPEVTPQCWREDEPVQAGRYACMIADLLKIPLAKDGDGKPAPHILTLLPEARERFARFFTEHSQQTGVIENRALKFHYHKLRGVAARLALIFYLCDGVTQPATGSLGIQEKHILGGIAVARWFGQEARRVYAGYETQADQDRRELLALIHEHGGTITPRAMGRARDRWADPEAAERALRDLVRDGYGELGVVPACGDRGRPSFRFKLLGGPADKNAETPESGVFVSQAESEAESEADACAAGPGDASYEAANEAAACGFGRGDSSDEEMTGYTGDPEPTA